MKTVALHNLGCKVNAYEMDVMQQMLQKHNYEIVQYEQKADVYVINTCTVTNIADRKSRQMLHRAKHRNPDAVVVAAGCYAETDVKRIEEDDCIDLLVGNDLKKRVADILDVYFKLKEQGINLGKSADLYLREQADGKNDSSDRTVKQEKDAESIKAGILDAEDGSAWMGKTEASDYERFEGENLERTAEHTRAYIKIQDGCNRFCTYCIIPYARGRVVSRHRDDVLKEITGLAGNGYREFVLTGIHISSYGIDFPKEERENALLSLIKDIAAIDGVKRIRIGSLEPMIVTEDFATRLSSIEQLCPHFHLSLQSGDDSVLKRMNRRYSTREYLEKINLLRKYFLHPAMTTDVIVGFPGETEEEFDNTVRFLKEVGFYEMHVFKYSKRAGTPAAVMQNQVSDVMKNERSEKLILLREKQSEEFRSYYIGRMVDVLMEEQQRIDGVAYWIGYSPEYVRFALKSEHDLQNHLIRCEVTGFLTDEILLLKEESLLEF